MKLIDQRDVFNIFHDGSIVAVSIYNNTYFIKIEIQYLAELVSNNYKYFYLELTPCNEFKFINWDNDETISDIQNISKIEPQILSCDKDVTDKIRIFCTLTFGPVGELWIKTDDIKIFDQEKNKLSLKELGKICNKYWDNFGKKKY
jgi:hypothetical protein